MAARGRSKDNMGRRILMVFRCAMNGVTGKDISQVCEMLCLTVKKVLLEDGLCVFIIHFIHNVRKGPSLLNTEVEADRTRNLPEVASKGSTVLGLTVSEH
jgi:hypothetical protein